MWPLMFDLFQLEGPAKARRIVVAMSGGVDSSVVAALAARTGAETIGITLQLYDHGAAVNRVGSCCAGQDIRDARAVCDRLGIAHYVFDHESRFRDSVIEQFADEYMSGRTPIPCVRCNMGVKFTDLFRLAKDLGADCLATGHYVRRVLGARGPELHRALDPARDQSYFLFATTSEQLDYLRFPLGGMPKPEVRAIAEEMGLAVALKPDSQDICFVPQGRYSDVVQKLRPGAIEPGDIVDLSGRVLGRHDGVIGFTVGQRKGLGLGHHEQLFVIRIDADRRQVVVGPREALATRRIILRDLNWLDGQAPEAEPRSVLARVRSTRQPVRAELRKVDGQIQVVLLGHEEGVAPGQACVLYDAANEGRMLGGGWIVRGEAAFAA